MVNHRLFITLDLPFESLPIQPQIARDLNALLLPYDARITISEPVHSTLLFIGNVSQEKTEQITSTIAHAIRTLSPIKPQFSAIRVELLRNAVTIRLAPTEYITQLRDMLLTHLHAIDIKTANHVSFISHITIGRISRKTLKDKAIHETITKYLENIKLNMRPFSSSSCSLYESIKGKHIKIKTFPL